MMRAKQFLAELAEAASFACVGSLEPEVVVRRKDGTEFHPAKLKASGGRIIICEDEAS